MSERITDEGHTWLIGKLRQCASGIHTIPPDVILMQTAAQELENLRREVERLRTTIKHYENLMTTAVIELQVAGNSFFKLKLSDSLRNALETQGRPVGPTSADTD